MRKQVPAVGFLKGFWAVHLVTLMVVNHLARAPVQQGYLKCLHFSITSDREPRFLLCKFSTVLKMN